MIIRIALYPIPLLRRPRVPTSAVCRGACCRECCAHQRRKACEFLCSWRFYFFRFRAILGQRCTCPSKHFARDDSMYISILIFNVVNIIFLGQQLFRAAWSQVYPKWPLTAIDLTFWVRARMRVERMTILCKTSFLFKLNYYFSKFWR